MLSMLANDCCSWPEAWLLTAILFLACSHESKWRTTRRRYRKRLVSYWAVIWLSMTEPVVRRNHFNRWLTVERGSPAPRSQANTTDSGNRLRKPSGSWSDKWAAAGRLNGLYCGRGRGRRLPGRGRQQAPSIRGAAREPDLTLSAGPLLPTQRHFDTGTAGFSDQNHISLPSYSDFLQPELGVEGVSAHCCPLLHGLQNANAAGGSGSCFDWVTALWAVPQRIDGENEWRKTLLFFIFGGKLVAVTLIWLVSSLFGFLNELTCCLCLLCCVFPLVLRF